MDLAAAVDELYGAPLADFVAVRGRLVTRAKQEAPDLVDELKRLRKPTVVAWLLNQVARSEPEVVADLLDLGERMRTAQAKGDGAALAAARPEREAAIDALVAAAGRCAQAAGTAFGTSAADGVGSTAVAALADPASGEALASGRLLRPLAYAGFGEVELDDAVAVLRLVPPLPEVEGDAPGDDPGDSDDSDDTPEGHGWDSSDGCESTAKAAARERRDRELTLVRDELREQERALSSARLAHSAAVSALEAAAEEVCRLEEEVARTTAKITRIETRPSE